MAAAPYPAYKTVGRMPNVGLISAAPSGIKRLQYLSLCAERRLLQPRDQLKLVEIDRPLLLEGDIARNAGWRLRLIRPTKP